MRANKSASEMQLTTNVRLTHRQWSSMIVYLPIYPPKTEGIVCVTENHSYQTPNIKGDKGDAGQKVSFTIHINLIFFYCYYYESVRRTLRRLCVRARI